MRTLGLWLVFAGFLSGAAFAQENAEPTSKPDGMPLSQAPDKNPDPRILEIDLDARVARIEYAVGETIDAWTYNGSLPGPLIRARVGDRLIVHFTNNLKEPTTVHWHGLRVPIEMDGVPGYPAPAVPPGGTFVYDFVLDDAGLFWYHPHVMSAAQVGFGLYGALLVDDPNDQISVSTERVMVLSDIGIEAPGRFEPPDSGKSTGMAFGREGNRLLVNGRERPTITARAGAQERWRIVNAAKSRYFELDFNVDGSGPDYFTLIGVDGGLQEYPTTSRTLVLAPGERADVVVTPPGQPGTSAVVRAVLHDRGYGSIEARLPFEDLFTINFADGPAAPAAPPVQMRRTIEPLATAGAKTASIEFSITKAFNGDFQYRVNGLPFQGNRALTAELRETQVWTVTNTTKWSHPFHLHGHFFQVLDEKGQPVHPLAWKDTVDVPYDKTVKIAVRFEDRPGMWMFHCHVLDHADGGLMGMVAVGVPPVRSIEQERRHHIGHSSSTH